MRVALAWLLWLLWVARLILHLGECTWVCAVVLGLRSLWKVLIVECSCGNDSIVNENWEECAANGKAREK